METAAQVDRTGRVVLGRYRLDGLIGRGGVGEVYRATDLASARIVAVKVMRDDLMKVRTAAARFLREARIARTLVHPAVPRGLESGLDATGAPLIVMEHIEGENFAQRLARHGPLGVTDTMALGARVADALDAAHRLGIIHRDIKPANLMLLTGGTLPEGVVVLDFGLAFCLDEPRLSVTHSLVGSLEYMSPEQARGEVVSSASDLYALAATLVHLSTGQTLYQGNALAQIAGHAHGPVPSLRARRADMPRIVEHYLTAMLDKDPGRRPSSAREVADALRELAPMDTASRPPPPSVQVGARLAIPSAGALPDAAARNAWIEQLHTVTSQLHQVTRAAAAAHQKMVQEVVQISARAMERAMLESERRQRVDAGDADAARDLAARIAALGDPGTDARREASLEAAAARLLERAREDESELLTEIQSLQVRVVHGATTPGDDPA